MKNAGTMYRHWSQTDGTGSSAGSSRDRGHDHDMAGHDDSNHGNTRRVRNTPEPEHNKPGPDAHIQVLAAHRLAAAYKPGPAAHTLVADSNPAHRY